jgi:cell division protein FtsW
MDYRLLRKFAWPIFAFSALLLVLVFVPHVGLKVNGARRWLGISGSSVRFEPSELAKVALIIVIAWYAERFQRQMGTWKRGIIFPGLFIGLTLGLIFIEPDRGTTILLAAVSGMLLVIAGVRWRFVVPLALAGSIALGFSLHHDTMRTSRISAWLHPEEHKMNSGYQANQAMLALGAGGWTGLGLGNSREKFGFLPEHHTDFIFPIIGEELGLAATLPVVMDFLLLIICGTYIAYRSSDTFGMILGSGLTFLIGLQALINIGVVTSTLPNKGLPLPFISYGGSNLLMMLTSIGLLLSIARRARVAELVPDLAFEGSSASQVS